MINIEELDKLKLKQDEIDSIINSMNKDAVIGNDLVKESLETSSIIHKWLSTEGNLKRRLFLVKRSLDQLYNHLELYYRGKLPTEYYKNFPIPRHLGMNLNTLRSTILSDREVKGVIESDTYYTLVKSAYEELEHYYELVKKYGDRVTKNRSFHINNAINAEKLKLGMF